MGERFCHRLCRKRCTERSLTPSSCSSGLGRTCPCWFSWVVGAADRRRSSRRGRRRQKHVGGHAKAGRRPVARATESGRRPLASRCRAPPRSRERPGPQSGVVGHSGSPPIVGQSGTATVGHSGRPRVAAARTVPHGHGGSPAVPHGAPGSSGRQATTSRGLTSRGRQARTQSSGGRIPMGAGTTGVCS